MSDRMPWLGAGATATDSIDITLTATAGPARPRRTYNHADCCKDIRGFLAARSSVRSNRMLKDNAIRVTFGEVIYQVPAMYHDSFAPVLASSFLYSPFTLVNASL